MAGGMQCLHADAISYLELFTVGWCASDRLAVLATNDRESWELLQLNMYALVRLGTAWSSGV